MKSVAITRDVYSLNEALKPLHDLPTDTPSDVRDRAEYEVYRTACVLLRTVLDEVIKSRGPLDPKDAERVIPAFKQAVAAVRLDSKYAASIQEWLGQVRNPVAAVQKLGTGLPMRVA